MPPFSPFKSSWLHRRFKSESQPKNRLQVESLEERVVLTAELIGDLDSLGNLQASNALITSTPVAVAGGPYSLVKGSTLTVSGLASYDSDPNQTLTYSWDINGDGVYGDTTGGYRTLSWATLASLGLGSGATTRDIGLLVIDTSGATSTTTATLTILPNTPPVASAGGSYSISARNSLTLNAYGSSDFDPNQSLTYSWDVNGDGVYGDATGVNPSVSWTNLTSLGFTGITESRNVRVKVTDSFGDSSISAPVLLTVSNSPPNARINAASYSVVTGNSVAVSANRSSDPDPNQTLTYSWDINGDGIFGDSTASSPTLSWSFLTSKGISATVGSTYAMQVKVTDNFGLSSTSDPVTLTVVANSNPIANAGGPYTIVEGKSLSVNASGSSDPDSQTLTYSWDINGDGTFGDATGVGPGISWSTLSSLGITAGSSINNVRVKVSDSLGASSISAATTLTVIPDSPPVANAGGPLSIVQGTSLQLDGTNTIPSTFGGGTYTWDLNGDGTYGDATGLNPLVTWSTLTSLGIGSTPETRTIYLKVSDNVGLSSIASTSLSITANTTPVITSTGGPYVIDQYAGSDVLQVTATDPDSTQTLTYSWDLGNGSFVFASASNQFRLTSSFLYLLGVPSSPLTDPITKYIRVKVTDGFGASATSDPFAIMIIPNTAPTADAGGPYTTHLGSNVALDASASFDPNITNGGQALSYAWDVDGDGDFTDATGVTPTISSLKFNAAPGTYNVRVQVSDGKITTTSAPTTLTILPDTAPVANAGGSYSILQSASLALNGAASSDPDAGDSLTYSWDLNNDGVFDDATGATPVLNWVSLNKLGIGQTPGIHSIQLRVEDNYGLQSFATATLTIVAAAAPLPATPTLLGSFTATDIIGVANGLTFFTATDSVNGAGLWRTDGSTAGTFRVASVVPFTNSVKPIASGNNLYFTAFTAANGYELWKSDGTVAGTGMVKDIWTGAGASNPKSFVDFNGTLYFAATDPIHGTELWKTDGTSVGTTLAVEFTPGADSSIIATPASFNGSLYLSAGTGYSYKTDGTQVGTSYLVVPTQNTLDDYKYGSYGAAFVVANDRLYYYSSYSFGVSDGTPSGTIPLSYSSTSSSSGFSLADVPTFDGKALFFESYVISGMSTTYITAVDSGNQSSLIATNYSSDLAILNDVLFGINLNSNSSLVSLLDGRSDSIISTADTSSLIASGNSLYFLSNNRIWKSDGTPTGTYQIPEITRTSTEIVAYKNGLIYTGNDSSGVLRLYSYFETPSIAPIANQVVNEGSTVSLNISSIGNSNTYSLAPDAPAGAAIDPLTGLFTWTPTDGYPDPMTITVLATTPSGTFDSETFTITVNNVAPTLVVNSPTSALRGELVSFTLSPSDVSAIDQASNFTYRFDWDGNGTDDYTVPGAAGYVVKHAFAATGANNVKITAVDKDGAVSSVVTRTVTVDAWRTVPDSGNPSLTNLIWSGTPGKDIFSFAYTGPDQITVTTTLLNGAATSAMQVFNGITGHLIAYGQQGDDKLDASSIAGRLVELRGNGGNDTIIGGSSSDLLYGDSDGGEGGNDSIVAGDGDDVVYADGPEGGSDTVSGGIGDDKIFGDPTQGAEGGGDLIDGGDGNDLVDTGLGTDTITGGTGNDVLIAGKDADSITAGSGQDLIITSGLAISFYASGGAGIQQLWNQWRTSDPIATRIAYLSGTPGGIISPSYVLSPGTNVTNDNAVDTVVADDDVDNDWILADVSEDVLHDTIDDYFTDL